MDGNMTLDYEPLISMNELLVRMIIKNNGVAVFDQTIGGFDQEAVIRFTTEAASMTGLNASEMEQAVADIVFKARDWWKLQSQKAVVEGFQAKFISSADLEKLNARHRWLIKRILARDQPVLWGGPKKSMKTSMMIDAAISLGSGKPFLNTFEIPQRVKVAVLSGESGAITIRETALRVAKSKNVALASCDVIWGFDLPRLGVDEDLMALTAALRENKVEVVFIDPAYLCLLAGNSELQANNMFSIGPLLMRVAKVCQEIGATLILVHHSTKPAGMVRMQAGEPLELEDLAYAGFQEFARQWVLINRRQKYEPGSGKHCLWLNIGGSAGQSGCWGVDVNEGALADDFSSRNWSVQVQTMDAVIKQAAQSQKQKKDADKEAKEEDVKRKVLQVLSGLDGGETTTRIAKLAGIDTRWVTPALSDLASERRVVVCDIIKGAGRGNKSYSGFRLAIPGENAIGGAGRARQARSRVKEEEDAVEPEEWPGDERGVTEEAVVENWQPSDNGVIR